MTHERELFRKLDAFEARLERLEARTSQRAGAAWDAQLEEATRNLDRLFPHVHSALARAMRAASCEMAEKRRVSTLLGAFKGLTPVERALCTMLLCAHLSQRLGYPQLATQGEPQVH